LKKIVDLNAKDKVHSPFLQAFYSGSISIFKFKFIFIFEFSLPLTERGGFLRNDVVTKGPFGTQHTFDLRAFMLTLWDQICRLEEVDPPQFVIKSAISLRLFLTSPDTKEGIDCMAAIAV